VIVGWLDFFVWCVSVRFGVVSQYAAMCGCHVGQGAQIGWKGERRRGGEGGSAGAVEAQGRISRHEGRVMGP
jgi:hypothetical protein